MWLLNGIQFGTPLPLFILGHRKVIFRSDVKFVDDRLFQCKMDSVCALFCDNPDCLILNARSVSVI